jgi:alkylation response protein AidB-like acyl-CoA dehydrogenase
VPDVDTIRAFLDDRHVAFAADVDRFARAELRPRPEPADDGAARLEARALLEVLGTGGWLAAIEARDLRSMALAREAIAAASPLSDAVYALQALSATPILLAGHQAARAGWVDAAVAGRAMGGFAMTEPEAGSDVASMATTARRDGGEWVLDGEKSLISNAGIADFYTVFAQTDPGAKSKGIACFVVPADAPGLAFAGAQVLSAPHPLGRIRFDGCRVPADACLAGPGEGFKLGLATLDLLRATVGAAACGMAARALEEAVAHALDRRQFGEPLAEFQLVREKLARMATELAASRLLVYRAAWTKDQGAARVTVESAMAKSYATEAAQRIVDEAVQILGGRGVLADHPVDRLYRSVRALRIYEGTTEIQRLVIAGHLLERARST